MQLLFEQTPSAATGDMDVETFRRSAHQVVDWIAGYLSGVETYPVLPHVIPGSIRNALPGQPPAQPEAIETILNDIDRLIMPGITHWNSGNFMGYFGLSGSGPSILGDMIDASLNVTRTLWRTSPAASEVEQVVLDWLRQMLGLPGPLFGMIHHNSAILQSLVAAREVLPDLQIRQKGMPGRREVPRLRLYASQEAHSAVDKAAIVLGIGQEGLRKIGTDSSLRMNVLELERAIQEDIQGGWLPFAVVATVGTTSTTSIDPVPQIADVCERYRLWLHVDSAYAGVAAIVPGLRWILAGCERADAITLNPHKWLFTSFGCSILYTRRPEVMKSAFSLTPDYLSNDETEHDEVKNLMDYDFSLPHRFPALRLWMVMRYFGQQGLAARISEHCRLARLLAQWIDSSPDFELMAPTPLSVVCFRAHPCGIDDEAELDLLNEHVMNQVNSAGRFFLSPTKVHRKFTLRAAIGNIRTLESHVRGIWEEIQQILYSELKTFQYAHADKSQRVRRIRVHCRFS